MFNLDLLRADSDTLQSLKANKPIFWTNAARQPHGLPGSHWEDRLIGPVDIKEAEDRFRRFRPVLQALFPELAESNGVIESPLLSVPALEHALGLTSDNGHLYLKADHGLPIAGSIKARGGMHEVLEYTERLALENGIATADDLGPLATAEAREFFSDYQVAVGSTGNLGLSIGVIASALGMKATVHMSADAKEWKKERLRRRNVVVIEHEGDYAAAVAAGRREAMTDPKCHFVDDESSVSLYLGYSAAGNHLKKQLDDANVTVDAQHPLFVYIPCGVGGAPAGIAFGLAHIFGRNVHCFFAEPTASPCFLVSMMDCSETNPSVYDIGLNNQTEADGLAVPQASACAVATMRQALGGIFTVEDDQLFRHVYTAMVSENIRIEPSAAAGFDGPVWLTKSPVGQAYLNKHGLSALMKDSTHIVWTTGGLFVPQEEYTRFYERGAKLVAAKN